MPRKKAISGAAAVPAGRRTTRRQTIAAIASSPMNIEDNPVQDKSVEQIVVDTAEEMQNNGPELVPPPLPHTQPQCESAAAKEIEAMWPVIVPPAQSETDLELVNEIETAIEKISIEGAEPVVVQQQPSLSLPSSVTGSSSNSNDHNTVADNDSNTNCRVSTPSVVDEDSKEEAAQALRSTGGDLDTTTEDDSLSIRRSSRIKTISKTKQKSRGHGLVRDNRDKSKVSSEGATSGADSLPSTRTPTPVPALPCDPAATSVPKPVPPPATLTEVEQKPQKIKSRWLDSAKRDSLDLNNSLSLTITSESTPSSASTTPPGTVSTTSTASPTGPPVPEAPPAVIDYYAPDPEVIECLKQLAQIKDNVYNCERNISKEAKKMTCDCFLTADEKADGELGCGEDCLNRLLMIECGSRCVVGERCTNRRFQTHRYAPVVVFKTEMKGFGLRAADDIQGGEFIMEYVGEVLNAKQFDKRANAYSKIKNKHYYFMALRSDAVIDATAKGNISRFINHSCDPNAETQKWTVNGELRIGFFTTRFIAAGEEVTFDYQYQRYGKEAQKCYCEAANCRGWIGEEPDSEDDDEGEEGDEEDETVEGEETDADDEEEGEEGDEERSGKGAGKKDGKKKGQTVSKKKAKATQKKAKTKTAAASRKKDTATAASSTATPKKVRRAARSRRQEILDDLDLDAEIDALSKTGLKNQAHTLKLSRMMVRAKLPRTRLRLLALIQGGEGPCRRLFLDYHGLRLLHGWMTDAQEQRDVELKLELVRTLQLLPIPNKTMLKDSHVLTAVGNYGGLKLDSDKKEIVSEEVPLVVQFKTEDRPKVEEVKQEPEEAEPVSAEKMEVVAGEEGEPPAKMEVDEEKRKAESDPFTEEERAEIRRVDLENEMRGLCKEMILKWVQLPEVFRIPKKERIEQMKEHEREADMRFMTLGLQNEEQQEKQNESRFKGKGEDIKWVKREFKTPVNDGMSKNQRRRLFAMQVEEQRRNQQRMDTWQHHEFRCNFFGLDPFRVRPEDVPSWVDLENRQWFTYDLTEVPTPPNYMHVTMKAPDTDQANILDYDIPKMDLPEGWEYAMDARGRLYYFHKKIRIPQWEVPIKLLPLLVSGGDGRSGDQIDCAGGKGSNGLLNGHGDNSREDDRNDDSSTTDTCDSDEEEMVKRINRIKKLHKIGVAHSTIVKLNLHERNSDDEVTREEVTRVEEEKASTSMLGQSKRLPNRESLVEYREISPRREEDRLYGQAEMKRYKETKEKFKQRKEMLKRRKLDKMMRAGLIGSDPEKRISFRSIPITDDELYDETEDEQEGEDEDRAGDQLANGSDFLPLDNIPGTIAAPLMEKIVLGNSRVDELDEPHKYNEMTRLKIRERNAKRSRAFKVQMKLKKMKMDEEHGEGGQVNGDHHQQPSHSHQQVESAADGVLGMSPVLIMANGTPLSGGGPSAISSDRARRIKDKFRANIAGVIVQHLSPYRRDSCPVGRITNNEDFKHLAKKLTHFVLVKELKHCATVADLSVNDSVKQKSKEFIRKYMGKYGKVYEKPANEQEY